MSPEALKALHEFAKVPELLVTVYKDLAKPGVSQVGKAIGTLMGLGNTILWPIALLNGKGSITLEKKLENYRKKLECVPAEQVCQVPAEIGVPIMEKLSYVSDDSLSSLYVNLLAKASTNQTAREAHPSFVNIINNLSPDEAVLLQTFRQSITIPFISSRFNKPGTTEWQQIGDELLTNLEVSIAIQYPENLAVYLCNFAGLGLIQIRRDIQCIPIELYVPLEKQYRMRLEPFKAGLAQAGYSDGPNFIRGRIDRTPFGFLFACACLDNLPGGKPK